ncbi:hypothetical protein [Halorubrum halophilum]|uniref:hypothetical protein n=1 Tax=Halorubrum halophilum TaxID=413816 RepID=UPI0006788279|nr:hypothetical protein [Halorubrum halophilum]
MGLTTRIRRNPRLLLKGIRDVPAAFAELNRLYHTKRSGPEYNRNGIDVFEEEWDNLIILDACRFDYFAESTDFDSPVERRVSRGSTSREFITGNFANRALHDVVYVSGNRWFLELREFLNAEVHAYRDVERDFRVDRLDDSKSDVGYVPYPETVLESAIEAAEEFPDKRLIIHLMQPHKPYLGPNSDLFTYDGGLRSTMAASGDVDIDTLRQAYRDTLEITLDHVESALDSLDGRTVITADHGELLGERLRPIPVRWYGHKEGVYVPELVDVPWQVVKEGPRREISADPPEQMPDVDEETVEDTLRALGYVP